MAQQRYIVSVVICANYYLLYKDRLSFSTYFRAQVLANPDIGHTSCILFFLETLLVVSLVSHCVSLDRI